MSDFYKKKEEEIRLLLGKKFQGKEFVLENMGNGTFIANLTDMYFIDGQWRELYINRVFHIMKEHGPLSTTVDESANKGVVDDVYRHMESAMSELLVDVNNTRYKK